MYYTHTHTYIERRGRERGRKTEKGRDGEREGGRETLLLPQSPSLSGASRSKLEKQEPTEAGFYSEFIPVWMDSISMALH